MDEDFRVKPGFVKDGNKIRPATAIEESHGNRTREQLRLLSKQCDDARKRVREIEGKCEHKVFYDESMLWSVFRVCKACGKNIGML